MATVQNPYRGAPPGTPIRPDGRPAGRGGRGVLFLATGVLLAAGAAYAYEHRPRGADDDTTVVSYESRPKPPEPVVAAELEPEPAEVAYVEEPEREPEPEVVEEEVPNVEVPWRGYDAEEPERPDLTQAQVSETIAKVRDRVGACGDRHPDATGTVYARLTITPAGKVSKVEIVDTPKPELGKCVAKAVGRARFPRSNGATVSFPFRFRE